MKTFDEWVAFGVEQGWVSQPCCDTHEGLPHTEEELAEFEEGNDPCVVAMRVYGV